MLNKIKITIIIFKLSIKIENNSNNKVKDVTKTEKACEKVAKAPFDSNFFLLIIIGK